MAESPEGTLKPGSMVGSYRIDHELGAGGVGTVYAAEEPSIHKRVAIKVLKRGVVEDGVSAARFEREARASNVVRHPNIVDVLSIGKLDDGRPYLVMPLLEGKSLRAELRDRGKLEPDEAWRIAREVAEALGAAHEAGIVHRDLKPDNVFLERVAADRPPRVRVLDFGVAKVEARDPEEAAEAMKITATGMPVGTPAYMAPEQWWCAGVDARTDQYALGGMLFEMLAGRPPFASQHFVELVQAHVHEKPPSLRAVGVEATEEVEGFVARLLAKVGGERFDSMGAVVEAGNAAFSTSTSTSTPVPGLTAWGSVSSGGPTSTSISRDPAVLVRRPYRRWIALHVGAIVGGGLGIVAAGYAGVARHDPRTWITIGGWAEWAILGWFCFAIVRLPFVARARLLGVAKMESFWLALAPAFAGAFGTYQAWRTIIAHMPECPEHEKLTMFNEGMYEANSNRFVGFALASLLFVSVAAIPGVSGLAGATTTLTGALGVRRKETAAACVGFAALAIVAGALGAPSGAMIAGVASAVLLASALLPTIHRDTAARDEMERSLAGLMAIALATGAGITRLEAREAALWDETPTRAARVGEILAAHAERTATFAIAVAAIVLVVAIEIVRARRLLELGVSLRPRAGTATLVIGLALGVAADITTHGLFIAQRDDLRARIALEFSLFARLDPPPGDALAGKFQPHIATAMQVAREAVAINAKGAARLAALASPEGEAHVTSDLNHALADAAAAGASGDVDLAVSIDREVKGEPLLKLFQIARRAGVRRVDILLTRGAAPRLVPNGPPEIGIVIPGDFVTLPAELAEAGFEIPPDQSFGEIAPALIDRALATGEPVQLAVRGRAP